MSGHNSECSELSFSIGLQVCRPDKLQHLLAYLRHESRQRPCSIHVVADRVPTAVREALLGHAYTATGGIGNWTSKNVLLRKCVEDDSDVYILLEDDLEFLRPGVFDYLLASYCAARQFLGFYKVNSSAQRERQFREYLGSRQLGGTAFDGYSTLNTSALLLIDRQTIERIGYFCNSYYEMGFYDYRDRLRSAGLIQDLLVPGALHTYVRVDDSVPSTISRAERAVYRTQVFPPPVNGYRAYDDRPAFVIPTPDRGSVR